MELITPESRATAAAAAWKSHYFRNGAWRVQWTSLNPERIHERLVKLGDTPSVQAVNEVIGNDSWTRTDCLNCGDRGVPVVRLGLGCDDRIDICGDCLQVALSMMDHDDDPEKALMEAMR